MSVNVTTDTVATVEITESGNVVVVDTGRDVIEVVSAGAQGAAGAAGPGVPTGGQVGNVLLKSGTANYATQWSAVVDGGTFA